MKKHKRDNRLIRYIRGEYLTDTETAEIRTWVEQRTRNREHFDYLKQLYSKDQFREKLDQIDAEEQLKRFREEKLDERETVHGRSIRIQPAVWVAAASLAILLGISVFLVADRKYSPAAREFLASAPGESITLDDGTRVELNSGSQLLYPSRFKGGERHVTLRGEGFFEVAKNEKAPFLVHVDAATVEVLGTSFNIKETGTGSVEVRVESGTVRFYDNQSPGDAVLLENGEMATFDRESGKISQAYFHSQNYLHWKTARLKFVESPLDSVFHDLGAAFGVAFLVSEREILLQRYTSECYRQSLEDILDELSIIYQIDYQIEKDTVYIYGKAQ